MPDTPIGPGTLLAGRFTLEDLLDETKGARFWRATDKVLARNVAVHVIAADDPRAEALLVAARTSATVTDAHLLRVLDAATEDGVTYVVNEWGSGVSLDRLLAEGPLSPRRAAWVVKEVGEAITTAHAHGIAHGRLLPENVMVTEAGSVKLIGFVVDAVLRGREQTRVTGGQPMGEHEADVVNLAGLLYASLTGRWPGTVGTTVPNAPVEHGRPLRPRRVRAGVPRPLDAICERVLHKDPQGQVMPLETAHEVYAALCDYIGDPTAPAPVGVEPTTFMDPAELAELRGEEQPAETTLAAGDPEATQAAPLPADAAGAADADKVSTPAVDPEATQAAAAPAFDDPAEEWADGWAEERAAARERPSPPPPPHLPEPEPKPLFASDRPRDPRPGDPRPSEPAAAGAEEGPPTSGGRGPRNGSLPPVWGPDADGVAEVESSREWETGSLDEEPPGRSWLRLGVALGGVVVLIVAVIVAFNLGQGSGEPGEEAQPSESGQASQAPKPVEIAAVSDFDPQGDPAEENPEQAPLAIDGDPSTAWQTLTYQRTPELGNLKEGVGLLLDLGSPVQVREVDLTLIGSPTDVELLATGPDGSEPSSTDGLDRIARQDGAGTDLTLKPGGSAKTRYLVVWLTSLPPSGDGFKGQIAEIAVRS